MDGLGSISEITDATGAAVERYSYSTFGKTTIKDLGNNVITESVIGNNYGFSGRRLDAETDSYYYRARCFSPLLGRFLQVDPLGYEDSMNLFEFCSNSPNNYLDPLGTKIRLNGTPEEKKMAAEWLSEISGTKVKVCDSGYVSSDFDSPSGYEDMGGWLKEMIEHEKTIDVRIGMALTGGGGFTNGRVTIDTVLKDPNQKSWYYREPLRNWLDLVPPHHYYRGEQILAHELQHAHDYLYNDISGSNKESWERRAIKRENDLNNLLGLPFRGN